MGAGFATGQEIYKFFTIYGVNGFWGIAISAAIICVSGMLAMKKAYKYGLFSVNELVGMKFGKTGEMLLETISVFMQFSVFIVMLSGMRTILCSLGINTWLSAAVTGIGAFLIISAGTKRVVKFNSVITPAVIFGIILVCVMLLTKGGVANGAAIVEKSGNGDIMWAVSAVLYGCFNSLLAFPVICSTTKYVRSPASGTAGICVGGSIVGIMAALVSAVLLLNSGAAASELPIVELAVNLGNWGNLYKFVIFSAMAGSGVICGRSTVELLCKGKDKSIWPAFIVCAAAIPLSAVNFSGLIGTLYPFFGALGILAIVFTVC